jgi:hypothetical protein
MRYRIDFHSSVAPNPLGTPMILATRPGTSVFRSQKSRSEKTVRYRPAGSLT